MVAEVTEPALVLGSAQSLSVVDERRADRSGLAVVRRRSGGGSVVLVPGRQVWMDFWIPEGHSWWQDDVVSAAVPVGELWADALRAVGVEGLRVHRSGLEATRWSSLVCFAGRGPGEVVDDQSVKWLGLSQRRTRSWIRLQTMVHRVWSPELSLSALAMTDEQRVDAEAELSGVVGSIGDADVVSAVLHRLPS